MPPQPSSEPEEGLNPNVPMVEDEEGEMVEMEMEPIVLGPPAYASPDPETSAGALVALEEHPNAENLSEDFGQQPEAAEEGAEAPAEGSYASMTKDELVEIAKDRGIEGYSSMTKAELVAALEAADAE